MVGRTNQVLTRRVLQALAQAIQHLPRMQLRGIMIIPEPTADLIAAQAINTRARDLFDALNTARVSNSIPCLWV
jgi:uncharacterized pyridoxal phosphate-containing UPF0001 family protein